MAMAARGQAMFDTKRTRETCRFGIVLMISLTFWLDCAILAE